METDFSISFLIKTLICAFLGFVVPPDFLRMLRWAELTPVSLPVGFRLAVQLTGDV